MMQTPDGQRMPMCEEDAMFMDEVAEVITPAEVADDNARRAALADLSKRMANMTGAPTKPMPFRPRKR
jgi:hypothetical protein